MIARRAGNALAWILLIGISVLVVLFALEPMFQYRAQSELYDDLHARLDRASNEASGLPGLEAPKSAEEIGAPIAMLEIGSIGVQQVVVEGATATNLQSAPAHLAGTAGLGQAGRSIVVAKRSTFGAPFGDLAAVKAGDPILVTTTQGESLYEVRTIDRSTFGEAEVAVRDRDELLLVTGASSSPLNTSDALVVSAELVSLPFEATPQRPPDEPTAAQRGTTGQRPSIDLANVGIATGVLLALAATLLIALRLQRRGARRVAYLLCAAPVVGLLVLGAERASHLLPGWW